jgi:hypothetical protein
MEIPTSVRVKNRKHRVLPDIVDYNNHTNNGQLLNLKVQQSQSNGKTYVSVYSEGFERKI